MYLEGPWHILKVQQLLVDIIRSHKGAHKEREACPSVRHVLGPWWHWWHREPLQLCHVCQELSKCLSLCVKNVTLEEVRQ